MATNLQPLSPSRGRLRQGDVFAMRVLDLGFLLGRVIDTEAVWASGEGADSANLIYVFSGLRAELGVPEDMSASDLLIPPALVNRLGWSRGYFQTLGNRALQGSESLPTHCFRDSRGQFFDERGNQLAEAREPVGVRGLGNWRTVDDDVSRALGIPLAPE